MDLAKVMDEVGNRLDTIDGLRVYRYPSKSIQPPAAIVAYPETYTYDETMRRGTDRMTLPVVVMIGKADSRSARDRLAVYLNGTGERSLKRVLERVAGDSRLVLTGAQGSYATTPDNETLRVTGRIGIEVDVAGDWTPAANSTIFGRWLNASGVDERSYRLDILAAGTLRFIWSADGAASLAHFSDTLALVDGARHTLAVDFTPDTGSGRVAQFYIDGQPFGDPRTGTATTIHPGTAPLTLGAYNPPAGSERFTGSVWRARVFDGGLGGTVVADADFRDLDPGTTTFEDAVGLPWTVSSPATVEGDAERPYTALDSLRVQDAEVDIVSMAGVEYLAATFAIDITGPGGT